MNGECGIGENVRRDREGEGARKQCRSVSVWREVDGLRIQSRQ